MENEAGTTMLIRGESLGGGKVRISRINNVEVEFTGEYSSVIVVHQDQLGLVAHIRSQPFRSQHCLHASVPRIQRSDGLHPC